MAWIVYKHTSPSGKVYIGITHNTPARRWRKDGSGYKHCTYFWKAIQKYGWDNIKHEILFDNLTEAEACQKEMELIAEYNATDPQYGYNDLVGGTSGTHSRPRTEEMKLNASKRAKELWADNSYRERVSSSHIGRKITDEERAKRSKATKGKPKPKSQFQPKTEETILKMRNSALRTQQDRAKRMAEVQAQTSHTERKAHPIGQYKDGVLIAEYKSMSCAAKAMGAKHHGAIAQCAKGKIHSAYGYQWQYIPKGEIVNG